MENHLKVRPVSEARQGGKSPTITGSGSGSSFFLAFSPAPTWWPVNNSQFGSFEGESYGVLLTVVEAIVDQAEGSRFTVGRR